MNGRRVIETFAILRRSGWRSADEFGEAAKAHAREVLKREPGFTVERYLGALHDKQESDRDHHREGLLKAGLPAA